MSSWESGFRLAMLVMKQTVGLNRLSMVGG